MIVAGLQSVGSLDSMVSGSLDSTLIVDVLFLVCYLPNISGRKANLMNCLHLLIPSKMKSALGRILSISSSSFLHTTQSQN